MSTEQILIYQIYNHKNFRREEIGKVIYYPLEALTRLLIDLNTDTNLFGFCKRNISSAKTKTTLLPSL